MSSPAEDENRFDPLNVLQDAFVAGLAVVVPLIVTLFVLNVLAGYLFTFLDAVVLALEEAGMSQGVSVLVVQTLTILFVVLLVLAIGFLTRFRYGELAISYVDGFVARVPGFGSIYESFREMSEVIVQSEERNFRDVKLVEFPQEETYTIGFLTTSTPQPLQEAVGRNDMVTLFLPLAPNPVMGGNLVHVPEHRVVDVDMSVEEGIRTIVTTGVATGGDPSEPDNLTEAELSQMAAFEQAEDDVGTAAEPEVEPDVLDRETADEAEQTDEVAPDGDLDIESGGRRRAGAREEHELGGDATTTEEADDDDDRQTEADMTDENTP
ncbi:DUF502 domain-containing protein [Haloarchaeobius iranensis]|uniref:Uncharacterized membrane protein n=1 Tax=Haloarchaeobius iranensis TaxID=996166 RepID=A0A1G9VXI8_9EURY|nr:DUF502 domain-containing protein [Haloarchaeobius iranensis]SDM77018.1 Uncharacterized membrane protein [Haloarchaeobius iranensis]